jgi:thioredoxin 1
LKKLLIIGGAIVAIFILIVVLSNQSNKEKLKDNPYGTNKLSKATINLIGNEHYDNIVLPKVLSDKITSGESVTAYYFHPECQYCMAMTPVMMPIAKEMGVDVLQYNMMEFPHPVDVTTWPMLVQYKDGKEVVRMAGERPAEEIRAFFTEFAGK